MKIEDFKPDMLVICKPKNAESKASDRDFHIYARVVATDFHNRRILLDKYLEQGRLHFIGVGKNNGDKWNDLDEEFAGFYSPMTNEEINDFSNGIKELYDARRKYPREDMAMIEATYEKVQDRASLIIEMPDKEQMER